MHAHTIWGPSETIDVNQSLIGKNSNKSKMCYNEVTRWLYPLFCICLVGSIFVTCTIFCNCDWTTFNICHLNVLSPSFIKTTCARISCLIFSSDLSPKNEALRGSVSNTNTPLEKNPMEKDQEGRKHNAQVLEMSKNIHVDIRWPRPWNVRMS